MASRIRFAPTITVPLASLAFSTHWDVTTSAIRRCLDIDGAYGIGSTQISVALAETTASKQSKCLAQFQSPKMLKAQTINCNVKGIMQVLESDAAMDAALAVHIRVVDGLTGTDRGVLWAPDKTYTSIGATPGTESYEMPTTKTSRKAPQGWSGSGHATGSLAVQNGDLLVVEVGYRHCNAVTTSYTGTIYYAGVYADDAAENETETATKTAWLEFSQTLLFEGVNVEQLTEHTQTIEHEFFAATGEGGEQVPVAGQTWPRGAGQ